MRPWKLRPTSSKGRDAMPSTHGPDHTSQLAFGWASLAASGMTPRRSQALARIVEHVVEHGHGPTMGEIAASLGVSRAYAHKVTTDLRIAGLVEFGFGRIRGAIPTTRGFSVWRLTNG